MIPQSAIAAKMAMSCLLKRPHPKGVALRPSDNEKILLCNFINDNQDLGDLNAQVFIRGRNAIYGSPIRLYALQAHFVFPLFEFYPVDNQYKKTGSPAL